MSSPQDIIMSGLKNKHYVERYLQKRLEAVLHAVPTAVSWARLDDKRITFVNKKFSEIFGYQLGDHLTIEDWINKTYINPIHVKRAEDTWFQYFESSGDVSIEIPTVEVDILCKDGSVKTTLHSGMIMPSEGWALATFTDITESKENELRFERLALEDDLTRLGNRRAFKGMLDNCLSRADRQARYCGLLLLDLDNFKELNDTYGHDYGDLALQAIADRLKLGVRGRDFVCRLGGDEFAVIVDCMETTDIIEDVANRILHETSKPMVLGDLTLNVNMSIGIAVSPLKSSDVTSLFKNADQALYRAKGKGQGGWSH